jgi:predicted phage gp36 major capsid-like protein
VSHSVLLLLEMARRSRAAAAKARRLSREIATKHVVDELDRHAAALDREAERLEECASALAATMALAPKAQ